jgi:hypothetical protein
MEMFLNLKVELIIDVGNDIGRISGSGSISDIKINIIVDPLNIGI